MTTIFTNKEKFIAFKDELKRIAEEIKKTKVCFKNIQKTKKPVCFNHCNEEQINLWKREWEYDRKLKSLKFQFRHRLIAYSIAKGKTYEQIEKKVHEGNEPNWTFVKGIQNELKS
jgi:Fe-S-cluster-containing dehydrogenase component